MLWQHLEKESEGAVEEYRIGGKADEQLISFDTPETNTDTSFEGEESGNEP